MNEEILIAQDLHKSFWGPQEIKILDGISLKIRLGESIAIMGASGEGKTTLLHILGTLESFDSGSLQIAGSKVEKKEAPAIRNRHIGFIFQSYNLLEDLTSLENILMPLKIARKPIKKGNEHYQRGLSLLNRVGLSDRADFPTKLLSGGERQRVAIARALCNSPSLLLADEPSGNLDHQNSKIVHQLLLDCAREENKCLIIVTHDKNLASLCDHTYLLQDGKLEKCS